MQVEQQQQQQPGNINFDLGIITVFDSNTLFDQEEGAPKDLKQIEFQLKQKAQSNLNKLYHQLSAIRAEREAKRDAKDEALQMHDFERSTYEIDLPRRITILPRSNKIPEQRKPTRWERFAKEKGIKKVKKRSRMVFDEETQEYLPRWGPYSKKRMEEENTPYIEVKQGEDIYEDPFQKRSLQKKLQKQRQKLNELKNKLDNKGYNAKQVISNMTNGGTGQPVQGNNKKKNLKDKTINITNEEDASTTNGKKKFQKGGKSMEERSQQRQKRIKGLKDKARKNLTVAQMSTASMGVFDRKAHRDEQQKKPQKRKNVPIFKDNKQEHVRNLDILDMVNRGLEGGNKKLKQQ